MGMCFREPLVEVIDETGTYLYGNVDEGKVAEIVEKHIKNNEPVREFVVKTDLFDTPDSYFFKNQVKIALRNCGMIDPENIEEYESSDGYKSIKKILPKKSAMKMSLKPFLIQVCEAEVAVDSQQV